MNRKLKIGIYLLIAASGIADLSYFLVRWPLSALLMIPVILFLFVGSILFLVGLINQIRTKRFPYHWLRIHLSTIVILLSTMGILAWKNTQPHWWYAAGTVLEELKGNDYKVVSYGWPMVMRRIEYGTTYEGYYNVPIPLEKSVSIPDLPVYIYLNILNWIIITGTIWVGCEWGLSFLKKQK